MRIPKFRAAWVLAAVTVLGVIVGCGDRATTEPAMSDEQISAALAIYEDQSCSLCHGEQAEGNDNGPALEDLAPYWDEYRLVNYLSDPTGFRKANPDFDQRRKTTYELEMPEFGDVPEQDRRLLAQWLLSR